MKWILPALFFVSSFAQAQKYAPTSFDKMPELLSYEQLMYLPSNKRVEYIQDIRNVLTELEADMRKSANSQANLETWREQLQRLIFSLSIPEAVATPAVPANVGPCPSGYVKLAQTGQCSRVSRTACRPGEREFVFNGEKYCTTAATAPTPSPAPSAQTRGITPSPGGVTPAPTPGGAVSPGAPGGTPSRGAVSAGNSRPAALPGDLSGDISAQRRDYSGPADGTQALPGECKLRTAAANFHADTTKFFKETNVGGSIRNCIMGGMFSEYNNNEIKVANCKKVQTFPPDSTAAGAEKLSCSGNKSMCNPLLYCGPKKGEAHCLPVSQEMTASCNAKAKPNCDPFTGDTAVPGAKDEWAEFKKNFDRTCKGGRGGSRFVEYFCKECKKVEERMKVIEEKYKAYTRSMPAPSTPRTPTPARTPTGGDGQGIRDI